MPRKSRSVPALVRADRGPPKHGRLDNHDRKRPVALRNTTTEDLKMSAYVVVELTVKDTEAKDRYSAAAGPVPEGIWGRDHLRRRLDDLDRRAVVHQRRHHPLP